VVLDGDPVTLEYLPCEQSMQSCGLPLPVDPRYLPATQSRHVVLDVEPVVVEYLPLGHREQDVDPFTSLNVPASHASHSPPFGPVYPASQTQSVASELPTSETVYAGHSLQLVAEVPPSSVEYLPLGHREQDVDPLTSLNFPVSHVLHSPPFAPVYPTSQTQSVVSELPASETACAGQSWQADIEVAAVLFEYFPSGQFQHNSWEEAASVAEYFPAEHCVHGIDPLTCLYVPAAHLVHSPPSCPEYPTLQTQWVIILLPRTEYVCKGQSLHVDSVIARVAPLYFPREHSVHGAEPLAFLYVPARHAVHSTPSALGHRRTPG
jgi:hypothetical protein